MLQQLEIPAEKTREKFYQEFENAITGINDVISRYGINVNDIIVMKVNNELKFAIDISKLPAILR